MFFPPLIPDRQESQLKLLWQIRCVCCTFIIYIVLNIRCSTYLSLSFRIRLTGLKTKHGTTCILSTGLLHWLPSHVETPHRTVIYSCRPASQYCRLTGVSPFTGSWLCSKFHLGWWKPSCPHWLRQRTGCCAAPPWSPRAGWALCSGSRTAPCGTGRSLCSRRPESGPHSRWTAPSRDRGEMLQERPVWESAGIFSTQVTTDNEWSWVWRYFQELDFFTFIEGDLKLGRLGRVLDLSRAHDRINAPIITKNRELKHERLYNFSHVFPFT